MPFYAELNTNSTNLRTCFKIIFFNNLKISKKIQFFKKYFPYLLYIYKHINFKQTNMMKNLLSFSLVSKKHYTEILSLK